MNTDQSDGLLDQAPPIIVAGLFGSSLECRQFGGDHLEEILASISKTMEFMLL